MPETTSDQMVSRAALLELRRDREVFEQGHRFLDEKRMLVAQEILTRLEGYARSTKQFAERFEEARQALRQAVAVHGVSGLEVYPPLNTEIGRKPVTETSFLGISVLEESPASLTRGQQPVRRPVLPSAAAAGCAEAFTMLLDTLLGMSVQVANLKRMGADYTRTERRARALEDILLPEMESQESDIEERLEEAERDEITRVRWFGK